MMSWSNPTHARAAELAGDYLPEYMANWIAGVLRETHTLPALIHHQDKLAQDVLSIAVVQHDDQDDTLCTLDECRAAPRCSSGATVWHRKTDACGLATFAADGGEGRD